MRIVGLNIQHGGGRRLRAIAGALAELEPDVAVLSEFHPGSRGDALLADLGAVGLTHQPWTTSADPLYPNAVAVVSREPIAATSEPIATSANRHRVLATSVGPLDVVAVYFPLGRPKVGFWPDEFLPYARLSLEGHRLLIGDWNTGRHYLDEAGATLFAADSFEAMDTIGWTDAWRALHPDGREFTWYSRPANNGFRLDHAFLSPSLVPALRSASYVHSTREDRVTDHSAIVVELDA